MKGLPSLRTTGLLVVANLALAGLALYHLSRDPQPAAPTAAMAVAADPAPAPQVLDPDPGPIERYAAIVERPLFNATRRPPPPPVADAGPVSEPVQAPTQYTLEGVVLAPQQRAALFRNHATAQVQRVAEGSRLGDWTLERLEAERVVLSRREHAHEIVLRRFDSIASGGARLHPAAQRGRRPP